MDERSEYQKAVEQITTLLDRADDRMFGDRFSPEHGQYMATKAVTLALLLVANILHAKFEYEFRDSNAQAILR